MPKNTVFVIALTVIILTIFATLFLNHFVIKPASKTEIDTAINQAKLLYRQKKATNEDLSNGPCLSNALMPNWVADLVHSPRIPVDDLSENQCSGYIEGRAQHFVELDLDGNLIRTK
ncbi:hypothetical protein HYT74_03440 [Candidatus Daviesbacteria bacterium]|nr:hypothetical protein [Candidatus Daviesbacteria bacterium]